MKFLLIGSAEDPHLDAIGTHLLAHGHEFADWSTGDVPAFRTPTVCASSQGSTIAFPGLLPEIDLIWFRKRVRPALHGARESDRKFLENECRSFIDSVLFSLEQDHVMINRASMAQRAASKVLQLRCAAQHAFPIPDTLVTNDAVALREFWVRNDCEVIYKPMTVSHVERDGELLVLPTTSLAQEHIDDVDLISGAPALYQQRITKSEEIRVTAFGENLIAAAVQGEEQDDVDWRVLFAKRPLRPVELPPKVVDLCARMLACFGLESATFDFVRDRQGEWLFLEMNEAGNFLFIDDCLPELRIKERYADFLIGRAADGGSA